MFKSSDGDEILTHRRIPQDSEIDSGDGGGGGGGAHQHISILKLCDRSLNETGDASMANAELLDVIRLEHTVRT